MTEPFGDRVRPIPMVRRLVLLVVALVAAVLLAGCGSAGDGTSTSKSTSTEPSVPPTPTGSPTLPAGEPPVTESFKVDVPGLQGPLFAIRQDHPRGGFQVRLFAPDEGAWTELEVEGRPLVPFTATDVQEHPLSVDCGTGGVVVTEAVPHKPAGSSPTWDILRTSYAVDGSVVDPTPTERVEADVAPGELSGRWASLVKHTMFESCRAAG